ncbi:MAG TPA: methyltransferase domain-containing protein [Polyangiaceae bacterium]|nr:methyltransferase domain-containing protein [Polyangiaceae bacterium]
MLTKVLTKLLSKLGVASWQRAYLEAVNQRRGIELGGPSRIFQRFNLLPLYEPLSSLDCCNFAAQTLWRGDIVDEGAYAFSPRKPAGKQYIREVTQLSGIADSSYDFVLASHVLEHVANPFKAMAEISRILVDRGSLILVLPHKDGTFDHRRATTELSHMVADLEQGTAETDMTHLEEWLAQVDLERAPEAKPFEKFRERSLKNYENRGMHHHVFDAHLAAAFIAHAGFQIQSVDLVRPMHIFILAQKIPTPDNAAFLDPRAALYAKSPFASDRAR